MEPALGGVVSAGSPAHVKGVGAAGPMVRNHRWLETHSPWGLLAGPWGVENMGSASRPPGGLAAPVGPIRAARPIGRRRAGAALDVEQAAQKIDCEFDVRDVESG